MDEPYHRILGAPEVHLEKCILGVCQRQIGIEIESFLEAGFRPGQIVLSLLSMLTDHPRTASIGEAYWASPAAGEITCF